MEGVGAFLAGFGGLAVDEVGEDIEEVVFVGVGEAADDEGSAALVGQAVNHPAAGGGLNPSAAEIVEGGYVFDELGG